MPAFLTGFNCSCSCSQRPGVPPPLFLQVTLLLFCCYFAAILRRRYMVFEVGIRCNNRIMTVISNKLFCCHVALAGMLSSVFVTANRHTIFLYVVWCVSVRHKAWRQQWTKRLLFFPLSLLRFPSSVLCNPIFSLLRKVNL